MCTVRRLLVFLSMIWSVFSATRAIPLSSPYCNYDKCLYCHQDNCIIVSTIDASTMSYNTISSQLPNQSLSAISYRPVLDIAQYALHQGDSRSANLVEGFIPLYQSSPNLLSFADIRFGSIWVLGS